MITSHTADVPAPELDGMTWVYHDEPNYDPCAALSYATVVQSEVGDAQFQNQVMLFHDGEYLGVGTDTVQQHTEVVDSGDDFVTVRYKDYEALRDSGEPFAAAPKYTAVVTYRWVGDHVEPEGASRTSTDMASAKEVDDDAERRGSGRHGRPGGRAVGVDRHDNGVTTAGAGGDAGDVRGRPVVGVHELLLTEPVGRYRIA
ncbi:LppP/LprE family lipoprotein [Corynebacterium variabile]|uniref:LppP/LprE family lipoprotein n=1 Tax=Corynebacterium variabile TaxID=1727 RepID=UPI0028E2D43C|nr:LppP/LprE family lipoprotein [Corynebacterium variabile]